MTWTALALCLLLSFVLSGLESAILTVSRVRIRHRAQPSSSPAAKTLQRLFEHRDRLLASLLLVNDVASLFVFAITTFALVEWVGPAGYAFAFVVSLPVYLFLFELVPKSLFRRQPYRSLRMFLPVLRLVDLTVGTLMRLASLLPQLVTDAGDREEETNVTRGFDGHEEFRSLTNIIERDGTLGPSESEMIRRVLDFPEIHVRELMIPLARVTAIPLDMPVNQIVALARKADYDQLPVMSSEGRLIGLIEVFEILRKPDFGDSAISYLRRIVTARPEDYAIGVFQRLRRNGLQLAAVCTEDGRPLGIVGTEDIVERMLRG